MDIKVNGKSFSLDVEPEMPLLWVLRDVIDLPGTKFGCGIAVCGACTVLVNAEPRRSCQLPVGEVAGEVTTIEGLAGDAEPHPVQQAWIDVQVPQCGYCQSGQILSAVALLKENPDPGDAEIDRAMSGNLCRCGTYPRIRSAIKAAARKMAGA